MQFKWRLEPEGHVVELKLKGFGGEEVSIDGLVVSSKTSFRGRSEHEFELGGRPVRIRIAPSGIAYKAELERDGVKIDPEPGSDRVPVVGVITGVLGAVGGATASRFFGMMLVIPFVVGFASFALAKKLAPPRSAHFVPAASLIWGHMAWIAVGLAMTGGEAITFLEVLAIAAGAAILLWKPNVAFAITLIAVEVAITVVNVLGLDVVTGTFRKAMLLHILLRGLAILALGWGIWRASRPEVDETDTPEASPEPLSPFQASLAAAPVAPPEVGSWLQCPRCRLSHRVRPERTCPKCGAPDGAGAGTAVRPAANAARTQPVQKDAPRLTMPYAVGFVVIIAVVAIAAMWPLAKKPKGHASDAPQSSDTRATVRGQVDLKGLAPGSRVRVSIGGRTVSVDREGRFELADVRAGTHVVQVSGEDTLEKTVQAEVVVAGGSEVTVPSFALTPLALLRGRVEFDYLPEGVRPPESVTLSVVGTNVEAQTDRDGSFAFEVPTGDLVIRAAAWGFEPAQTTVSASWGRRELKLPALRRAVNQECTPRVERVGPVARDLVGAHAASPDRRKDHLLRIIPCRGGLVQRVRLHVAREGSRTAWDSERWTGEFLGVSKRSAPDKVLNATSGFGPGLDVSANEQLLVHVANEPQAGEPHELWLHYADGTFDRAELPPGAR